MKKVCTGAATPLKKTSTQIKAMPSVRVWAWIFCSQTLSTKPEKKTSTQIKAMGMDFLATMNVVLLWAWRHMGALRGKGQIKQV